MSQDYSHMRAQLAGDLKAAAAVSSSDKTRTFQIPVSELPSLIPSGVKVKVESLPIGKLKPGDIICVSLKQQVALRRFIKLKITENDTFMLTAHEGLDKKQPLPKSCLLGRVSTFEGGGQTHDPYKRSITQRIVDVVTEYGTHVPFGGIFGRGRR